ncbi:MAG: DUF481 domain-containing protein [Bacteroidota bacterium]
MRKLIQTLLLVLASLSMQAQTVINTEEMRLLQTDKKLVGLFDINLGTTRNKAGTYLKPKVDMRLELNEENSRYILLGGYQLTRFSRLNTPGALPTNFTNKGFGHFRYNRKLKDRLIWEAFTQIQYDEIQEIDQRFLVGTGPRFQLAKGDSLNIYFGSLYMYEYEETSDEVKVFNKHHRMSFYLSGNIQFNPFVGLSQITYFQPRLDQWSDFRVSTTTQLIARISKHVSFDISAEFLYDALPPGTVPNTMYDISAGLAYVW